MEMQWIRENMETEQIIAARPTQVTVEAEVALPGGLREEARVYYADATVQVNGGELAGSRITADTSSRSSGCAAAARASGSSKETGPFALLRSRLRLSLTVTFVSHLSMCTASRKAAGCFQSFRKTVCITSSASCRCRVKDSASKNIRRLFRATASR